MKSPFLLLPLVFAISGVAPAALINIDFSTVTSSADRFVGEAAVTDDPAGSAAIWNNVVTAEGTVSGPISATGLVYSTGAAATGVTVTLTGVTGSKKSSSEQEITNDNGSLPSYSRLMGDYLELDSGSNTTVATPVGGLITGLVAGNVYNLYLYGQGSDMDGADASWAGENSLFSANGGPTEQTGWDGFDGGNQLLVEGIEYVMFTVQADGSGSITFSWTNVVPGDNVVTDFAPSSTDTGSRFAALNGLQIVNAVPEPSVALLGGLGMLGLFIRRRR
jgi:hypothetical protein